MTPYLAYSWHHEGLAKHLPEDDIRGSQALFTANQIANHIWPQQPDDDAIERASQLAKGFLSAQNGGGVCEVSVIGHCHIDTAWLWSYRETKRKAARSFATALCYLEDSLHHANANAHEKLYPFYKFCCSQAQQLHWVKEEYPHLFHRIQEKVRDGQFVVTGGSWVEMDCNIPGGEAMVRQFLYGVCVCVCVRERERE